MFEERHAPLAPRQIFVRRMLKSAALAGGLVAVSLVIGAAGYHAFEGHDWLEATLNAAMILTGMGPVDAVRTTAGKVFAIAYSLYSGVVFLTTVAVLFAPAAHRFLHRFHLEPGERKK